MQKQTIPTPFRASTQERLESRDDFCFHGFSKLVLNLLLNMIVLTSRTCFTYRNTPRIDDDFSFPAFGLPITVWDSRSRTLLKLS